MLYFIFIYFSVFLKILLGFPFWPKDYVEVCCLIFKCLEIFLLSFCYVFLVWFCYGQRRVLYDFNSFNLLRFVLWPRKMSIFVNVPCVLKKNIHSLFEGKVFYTCYWSSVGWFVVQPFCVIAHFLSSRPINCWDWTV